MGRAPDHEIVGSGPETFAQPAEISLMAAATHDKRLRDGTFDRTVMTNIGHAIPVVAEGKCHDFAVITDADAKFDRGAVKRVDHCLAAAKEEGGPPRIRHRSA